MKTFCYPCKAEEEDFKVRRLEVYCSDIKNVELAKLISTLTKKGFEVKHIIPDTVTFILKAEVKGDREDTQVVREELEKEGFTEETFDEFQ